MQSRSGATVYDVCIVGSGAGGGMAAHALTKAGARVALLEAGQMWDPIKDGAMLKWPYDSPRRGASTREAKEVCRGCVVREDCLEYALANGEKFGIWGGMSERERRRIRRQRALARTGANTA